MPLKMRKLSTLSSAFGLAVALFLSLTFLVPAPVHAAPSCWDIFNGCEQYCFDNYTDPGQISACCMGCGVSLQQCIAQSQ